MTFKRVSEWQKALESASSHSAARFILIELSLMHQPEDIDALALALEAYAANQQSMAGGKHE